MPTLVARAKALSLEAQAAQLLEVTIQLGLEWFVGLGVGAGANVLLRFACDNPGNVAGLILANASAEAAGEPKQQHMPLSQFVLAEGKSEHAVFVLPSFFFCVATGVMSVLSWFSFVFCFLNENNPHALGSICT